MSVFFDISLRGFPTILDLYPDPHSKKKRILGVLLCRAFDIYLELYQTVEDRKPR